ncbi:MAG: hypothetical protein AABY15_01010 [Nanoarchaeota archaeon]
MKYKLLSYIPVEAENPAIFDTLDEAEQEAEHLRAMQPENKYEVNEVEKQRT